MIKELVEELCALLKIDVPEIIFTTEFPTKTMQAMVEDGKLYLRNKELNPDLAFAIAHETRHLWQMEYHAEEYYKNYKQREEVGIEKYNLQLAEVDANAFATIIMKDFFGLKPLYNGMTEKTIVAIKKRIDELVHL